MKRKRHTEERTAFALRQVETRHSGQGDRPQDGRQSGGKL